MAAMLPIILASSHLLLAADRVPQFDIGPSCHRAHQAAIALDRDDATCRREEQAARARLEREWNGFSDRQQRHCVRLSTLGGDPSYVELLTCLELGKDAERLPADRGTGRKRIE